MKLETLLLSTLIQDNQFSRVTNCQEFPKQSVFVLLDLI